MVGRYGRIKNGQSLVSGLFLNNMETVYEETYKNCLIKIYQDDCVESPDGWGDENVFLVAYDRDFTVERNDIITKEEAIAISTQEYDDDYQKQECKEIEEKYHIFGLEAYIHSGISLSLSHEGNFPDRQWDVSQLGLVLISKEETKDRNEAKELARGLLDTWNDYFSGNVYGYIAEDENNGIEINSCWGFYGDYNNNGILDEIRKEIDYYVKNELKESRNKKDDLTKVKLGELLGNKNEGIRRNAIGILKQLQKENV